MMVLLIDEFLKMGALDHTIPNFSRRHHETNGN